MQERIDKILSYLEETGESRANLARSAGINPSTLTEVLKNNYKGKTDEMLSKIEDVIQNREDKRAITFKAPELVQTTISRQIKNALRDASTVSIPRMLVLYGNSGIGKTRTITQWTEDNSTAILVEVSPDFTFGSMLQEIAQEIGVHSTGKHYEIRKRIVNKLKNSNKVLIIDEAEYLTPKSLDILRRIHDKAQIPVVLVGMPALYHNIKSLRKGFEQIANRMVSYNLGAPEDGDMEKIVKTCMPNATDSVCKALITCSKGTIRTLILLMQDLVNYSAETGETITADTVHSFVNSLH